jgi:putative DNA primase/helicase
LTGDSSDVNEKRKIESDVPLGLPQKSVHEHLQDWKQELGTMPEETEHEIPKGITNFYLTKTNRNGEEETKFSPPLFAKTLINFYHFKTEQATERIYVYDKALGIYTEFGEQTIKTALVKSLEMDASNWMLTDIYLHVKAQTYEKKLQPSKLLAVENGLWNPIDNTLKDFTYKEFVTNKLNAKVELEEKSDRWIEFINQVCPNDKDALQELSGYLLLKNYPFHAIFWLLGTGRNGKGTWVRTMEDILGQENCSAIGLEEFDGNHRFALYQLHNSLFNISSEPKVKKILDTELLKKVTGKDTIEAESKKNQARIKFRNVAKEVVQGNEYPKVEDITNAFWDRVKLIEFPNRFEGDNQIQDIEDTWLNDPKQKSGILNWMQEGLARLLKNHKFSLSKSQEQQIIQFKRASDSIGAFLTEHYVYTPIAAPTRKEAYEQYKEYCESIGIANETDKVFASRLQRLPKIKDAKKRISGVAERVWIGLYLKPLVEETEESNGQQTLPVEADESPEAGCISSDSHIKNIPTQSTRVAPASPASPASQTTHIPTFNEEERSDLQSYHQLTCYFCQKPITDADWTSDDFSENKPAHQKCYDQKKSELKEAEDQREFSDDPPSEEKQE